MAGFESNVNEIRVKAIRKGWEFRLFKRGFAVFLPLKKTGTNLKTDNCGFSCGSRTESKKG